MTRLLRFFHRRAFRLRLGFGGQAGAPRLLFRPRRRFAPPRLLFLPGRGFAAPRLLWLAVAIAALAPGYAGSEAAAQQPPPSLIDLAPVPVARPAPAGAETQRVPATPIDDTQAAWKTVCAEAKKDADRTSRGNGVAVLRYDRTKVMCLNVRATMFTTILLPEFDSVVDFYVGDPTAFEVIRPPKRPNVLLIRPKAEMVEADTQITVIGAAASGQATAENAPWGTVEGGRNVYTFYVRSYPIKAPQLPDLTVFVDASRPGEGVHSNAAGRGRKPTASLETSSGPGPSPTDGKPATDPERKDAAGKPSPPDYVREVPFDVDALSFDSYTIFAKDQDSVGIAPERVFTDGVFTFLDFGERRADSILRPVVFRVVDQVDTKVNTRTVGPRDNILVVEAVGNLTLRNGARIVCLRYRIKPRPAKGVIVGTLGGEDEKAPPTNPSMPVYAPSETRDKPLLPLPFLGSGERP